MKAVHEDLIRRRAYEIWEQSGRPLGMDKEHWAQAEKELLDAAPIKAETQVKPVTTTADLAAPAVKDRGRLADDPVAKANPAQPRARSETVRAR